MGEELHLKEAERQFATESFLRQMPLKKEVGISAFRETLESGL